MYSCTRKFEIQMLTFEEDTSIMKQLQRLRKEAKKHNNFLWVGLPSRGRLAEPAYSYLGSAGYIWSKGPRELVTSFPNKRVALVFVHPKDAARLVASGYLDLAISAIDILKEYPADVSILRHLGFATCQVVLGVPIDSMITTPMDLEGKTVATTYPNIAKNWFHNRGVSVNIISLNGALEMAPFLGLSDGIIDSYKTGESFASNNLRVTDILLKSQAVLVGRKRVEKDSIQSFIQDLSKSELLEHG